MRIALVDDDAFVRRLLARTLGNEPRAEIVWDADSGEAALEQFLANPVDVVLVDLQMPGMSGIATVEAFQKLSNPPVTIAVSALTTVDKVQAAFRAGVRGYFMKEDNPALIVDCLQRALKGELVFSPKCSKVIVEQLKGASTVPLLRANGESVWEGVLSDRELEIVQFLADSLDTKEIARKLGTSVETVRKQIQSLMSKLGVNNRAGAVAVAFRAGLLR